MLFLQMAVCTGQDLIVISLFTSTDIKCLSESQSHETQGGGDRYPWGIPKAAGEPKVNHPSMTGEGGSFMTTMRSELTGGDWD